MIAKLVSDL